MVAQLVRGRAGCSGRSVSGAQAILNQRTPSFRPILFLKQPRQPGVFTSLLTTPCCLFNRILSPQPGIQSSLHCDLAVLNQTDGPRSPYVYSPLWLGGRFPLPMLTLPVCPIISRSCSPIFQVLIWPHGLHELFPASWPTQLSPFPDSHTQMHLALIISSCVPQEAVPSQRMGWREMCSPFAPS